MSTTISLPKNKQALARVIDQHAEREEARLQYRRTTWLLAWYYLNGARRFDVFDPELGTIRPHYLDEDGSMEFQSQELLSAIDKVSARLAAMDVTPLVRREGTSLQGMRERSVAQILLDAVVNKDHVDRIATQFAHIFTSLGSCGIAGHIKDVPSVGLVSDLEVIHPREIFPFPSLGNDYTKAQGLMRQRSVPLSFLKETFGKKVSSNLDKIEYWEQKIGEGLREEADVEVGGGHVEYQDDRSIPGSGSESNEPESMGVAKIREVWILGSGELVERYIVTSGDYVLLDESYDGLEVYCPIGFARFMENGTFHGAGLFDLLFSISREMERLLKSLFNNIRDIDRYGVLVLPQGQFNERALLRDVGKGLRVLPYDPDPVSEGFKPFSIQPFNAGDIPGKVASLAKQLMDGINPVRDLIEEKGRIDSASGLNFLDEEINKSMSTPTRGMERAFGQCYRATLSAISRSVAFQPRTIPVTKLTLDLAGAIINSKDGTVSFQENPVPSLTNLRIGIKEVNPKSVTARKSEALELLQMGITDPDSFKLYALKEGIDFAFWMDEEEAAYQSVVRNCLILFGDGEVPGEVVLTPHTAKPEFQLRVLMSFLASPTMLLASSEVQDEFMKYRQFLFDAMGMTLPEAVPNPDDMALLIQTERAAMEREAELAQREEELMMQEEGPIPFNQSEGAA
jgi:hypothetical protein